MGDFYKGKIGEWKIIIPNRNIAYPYKGCSLCHTPYYEIASIMHKGRCWNCGADMRGEKNETEN